LSLGELIFLGICAVVVVGALGTIFANSLIYAVLFLVLAMFGISGLYIYLGSPFVAMMQILIYIGAVSVLVVFAIMLAGPFYKKPTERGPFFKVATGVGVSALAFIITVKILKGAFEAGGEAPELYGRTKLLGRAIMDRFPLPFELISLLIVSSIIGAILLALLSRQQPPKEE